jgi:peptide/nickel transport system ATP-binding protein
MEPLLQVRNLHTYFFAKGGTVKAVNGVSFDLMPGERLAIVGESGSGKSAMAMSLIRLIAFPGRVVEGSVRFDGRELLDMTESELNTVRGRDIGTVFQDPMSSLNPVMRIGDQLIAPLRKHMRLSVKEAERRAVELLRQVGIPAAEERLKAFPFELSGGMRQRVMIALAIACRPKLIIADEPTTALDVTIQAQIVELLKSLSQDTGSAMLFITHDLGLVARFAQKVAVMYAGRIVEMGDVTQIFHSPKHPYTQCLLRTIPSIEGDRRRRLLQIEGFPPDMRKPIRGCAFRDRCPAAEPQCAMEAPELVKRAEGHVAACWLDEGLASLPIGRDWLAGEAEEAEAGAGLEMAPASSAAGGAGTVAAASGGDAPVLAIRGLGKTFLKRGGPPWRRRETKIRAVRSVDLSLRPGEAIGIVGESGCGKSTLARMLLGLEEPTGGDIARSGEVQIVFQDPYDSFNPKMRIADIIAEPLDVRGIGSPAERRLKVRELIQKVGLDPIFLDRYPSQLSGGQRQRVGIARALALDPKVVVADEPTSALDVSVRAQIINLLNDLKEKSGVSFIFISHDLSTVRHISDTIAVMYLGEIVEYGNAEEVFREPAHPYTAALLDAVPVPDPVKEEARKFKPLGGELPSPANPPAGCAFCTRCPLASDRCRSEKPPLREIAAGGRKAACHEIA